MMNLLKGVLAAALLVSVARSMAQTPPPSTLPSRFVNLDTPAITPRGALGGRAEARFLNSPEDVAYTSVGVRYGLFDRMEIGVRAVTGATRRLAIPAGTISYGGQDVELYGKVGASLTDRVSIAGLLGVAFPATPAQNQAILTLGASGSFQAHDRIVFVLNPRAMFQEDNITIGVGVGASARLGQGLALIGDWTFIAAGNNTRSTSTGAMIRRNVWGAALQWSSTTPEGLAVSLDLGYGNALGLTTGFSLTPGLGRSDGLYLALVARR
jgi:hypothetical protein